MDTRQELYIDDGLSIKQPEYWVISFGTDKPKTVKIKYTDLPKLADVIGKLCKDNGIDCEVIDGC